MILSPYNFLGTLDFYTPFFTIMFLYLQTINFALFNDIIDTLTYIFYTYTNLSISSSRWYRTTNISPTCAAASDLYFRVYHQQTL